MLAPIIDNHVAQAQARLMQQYKAVPPVYTLPLQSGGTAAVSAVTAPLISFVDQIQLLENAIFALDQGRQLYNGTATPAYGQQLDGLGQIIGFPRNGLSDAEYTLFLFGTIAENNSDTTIPTLLALVALLFQASPIIFLELFPAEVAFEIPDNTPLPVDLFPIAVRLVKASIGAGIGLGFVAKYPATSAFRMGGLGRPSIGGGFGSLSQSGGGGFASNFYSNVGA